MSARTNALTFKGNPISVVGPELKVGDTAPDFQCLDSGLGTVGLTQTGNRTRIFSVVPSLDTPVCSLQTKKFEEHLAKSKGEIDCYTVSLDLPFAQKRFCTTESIENFHTLSDTHNHSFGKAYGVLIDGLPLPLLARAVFVVGPDNRVQYVEYVPEVTSEPNYTAALAALPASK